jgi:hypothetical protein
MFYAPVEYDQIKSNIMCLYILDDNTLKVYVPRDTKGRERESVCTSLNTVACYSVNQDGGEYWKVIRHSTFRMVSKTLLQEN